VSEGGPPATPKFNGVRLGGVEECATRLSFLTVPIESRFQSNHEEVTFCW